MVFKTRIFTLFVISWLVLSTFVSFKAEESQPFQDQPMKRVILALYDSSSVESVADTKIHKFAEMPLNHLGCVIRYHDLVTGLPPSDQLKDVHGILTWFSDDSVPHAVEYCLWLRKQLDQGMRLVVLDDLGAVTDTRTNKKTPWELVNSVFEGIGLSVEPEFSLQPLKIKVVSKNSEWVEYERSLFGEVTFFQENRVIDNEASVFLKLKNLDFPDSFGHAVVVTSRGGYVMSSYALYQDPISFATQWRIDPFKFFEQAFALKGRPRPDVTTQNGKRLWFCHIDGDGFANESFVDGVKSSKIIYERILKKYDALPFTISVVVCRQDEEGLGSAWSRDLAKKMFLLDNVEAASHGYGHPLDWQKKILEIKNIPNYSEYSSEKEIEYSTQYINQHLLPPHKKVEIFLWTGYCNPTDDDLKIVDRIGLLNMNGGDSRMDGLNPSYSAVAPLARPTGYGLQPYAGMANENIFTNYFSDPIYGFKNVLQTIKNTETPQILWTKRGQPRRVSPVNIYFHYYIADKPGAFASLVEAIEESGHGHCAPVYASEYIRKVKGFFSAKMLQLGLNRWRVSDYGSCRTIRFDGTTSHVDLAQSKNCLGYKHHAGNLFVHLEAGDQAEIVLKKSSPDDQPPYLIEASHQLNVQERNPKKLSFTTKGLSQGNFLFYGGTDKQWTLIHHDSGKPQELVWGEEGVFGFSVPAGKYELQVQKN